MKSKRSWIYDLVSGLVLIILGILFICLPDVFTNALGVVCGSIAIIFGVFVILFSLITPNLFSTSLFGIFIGGMTLIIGIIFLSSGDALTRLIPILFSIYLIVSGISKITESANLNRLNISLWIPTLIFGILYVAGGITMLFFIDAVTNYVALVIGILLILLSISYFFDMFIKIKAKKTISKVQKTIINEFVKPNEVVIDADFEDKDDNK